MKTNVNYAIKDLLDLGFSLSSDSGANIKKWNDNVYIYQESHGGCIEGNFNNMMSRFIESNTDSEAEIEEEGEAEEIRTEENNYKDYFKEF